MTEKEKVVIDAMTYESMLRAWRQAPLGAPLFKGERGKYFARVMFRKKGEVGGAAHVAASKNIGWD